MIHQMATDIKANIDAMFTDTLDIMVVAVPLCALIYLLLKLGFYLYGRIRHPWQ